MIVKTKKIIYILFVISLFSYALFKYREHNIAPEDIYKEEPHRILDVILFNTELDYLEIRLNELYDTTDIFYIIESNKTFSGKSKSLVFKENMNKFNKFLDKIVCKFTFGNR